MGHYYSYKAKQVVSRSSSSHTVQFLGGAADAFRYSLQESRASSISSSSISRKVHSADVLKHRVRGAEGQVWTNLASWTGGRVDAIDFGGRSKHAKQRHHSSSSRRHQHKNHNSHRHSHHHHHSHHHTHTHHHHGLHDEDLDDVTARFDRSVRIASSSPATRVSSPSPQRRPSSQPRSHPRPRPRSPSPPVNEAEYLDPPPPYSQLSGRPSGGIGSDRLSSRKAREREHDPPRPIYNHDRNGAAAVATVPSPPPPSSWLTPGSRSTSTLFSPSQVREPREELPARDGEKKKATNSSSGGGIGVAWCEMRARDSGRPVLPCSPESGVLEGYGRGYGHEYGYKGERSTGRRRSSRARDRDRKRAVDADKRSSYLVPGASTGTNLGQCPYLRRIHGGSSRVTA